jgi:hypothetical protein
MEFGFIYLEKFTDEWDPPVSRSVAGCHAPIGWPGRCRARAGIRSVRSLLCSKPTTSLFERRASVRARHRHCPAVLRPSVIRLPRSPLVRRCVLFKVGYRRSHPLRLPAQVIVVSNHSAAVLSGRALSKATTALSETSPPAPLAGKLVRAPPLFPRAAAPALPSCRPSSATGEAVLGPSSPLHRRTARSLA